MLKTKTTLESFLLLIAAALPVSAETPAPSGASTLSPFGIGACHQTSQTPEKWIPQMAQIGIGMNRSAACSWAAVEPAEGKWEWAALDRQMQCMTDNKIESGGLLIGYPAWSRVAGEPAGIRLPVNNLAGWSNYVTQIVGRYKDRVKYWEVWNEPPNFTGKDQTAADYAKIVVAAYDAAKAANPDCKIGLATKSAHVNYLKQAIEAGAKDHFDYITVHPYEILSGVADGRGTEPLYMHIVPTIRKMLADVNPAKADAPVWFTELGVDSGPVGKGYGKGSDVAAQALVKAYTMGIAQGVACINWFEGMDGDSGPMGLLDAAGKPRPNYTAMTQLIRHLGPHPKYLGWVLLNGKDYGFVFQGAQGTVLSTWAPKGTPDHVAFGQPVEIVDPLTGAVTKADACDLTTSPVLVLGVPASLVAEAKANKAKPFSWGGDYSDAKSVSIETVGDKTVEKGLHTLAGEAVAAAVVAYGGNARSGDIPGGNTFIVDPNFLSYTATPIRITAVVRRNEANANSGFKLVYESTAGYKTLGWYTVPDNKQWHTVTWDIDNAQFVNMWGFGFRFDSDGNQYNKYYIQSVTVEKAAKAKDALTSQ